jgi:hypothetical protein
MTVIANTASTDSAVCRPVALLALMVVNTAILPPGCEASSGPLSGTAWRETVILPWADFQNDAGRR